MTGNSSFEGKRGRDPGPPRGNIRVPPITVLSNSLEIRKTDSDRGILRKGKFFFITVYVTFDNPCLLNSHSEYLHNSLS